MNVSSLRFLRTSGRKLVSRKTINGAVQIQSFSPKPIQSSLLLAGKQQSLIIETHNNTKRNRSTFTHNRPSRSITRRGEGNKIQRNPLNVPSLPSHQHAPAPSHFAPQPPPHHGAPRLIRHPPTPEAALPPPSPGPSSNSGALFQYSRGPTSRLFSFRNSATSASTSSSNSTSFSYTPSSSSSSTIDEQSIIADMSNGTIRNRKGEGKSTTIKGEESKNLHEHEHEHQHSHGWLGGHSHSHSHGAEGSAEEADKLIDALKGKGDRGSNITVIGLIANLILCGTKGVAGVFLHSASLLADAAHSLSDTFSDLVTLFCWKMSQRPASQSHPMGYGKFETMGGLGVSVVLVGGAFAIGMHSYGLLLEVLQPHFHQMPSGLQALGSFSGDLVKAAGGLLHHDHHHHSAGAILDAADGAKASLTNSAGSAGENLLDPNAMWFALISVLVKEWLYHATLKIAREEKSSVLEANAIHHRSDSLSSGVTFLAIGGSYMGFPVLDPLGGLLVAGLIGKQGIELLINALADLSDRGVQREVLDDFEKALQEIVDEVEEEEEGPAAAAGKRTKVANHSIEGDGGGARLLGWKDLRAVRSGVSTFVDVTLIMREDVHLKQARLVEQKVREKLTLAVKGVKEVRIHLDIE